VVPRSHHIDTGVQDFISYLWYHARTLGGVFDISDYKLGLVLLSQCLQR
jgi:hypothetical protein